MENDLIDIEDVDMAELLDGDSDRLDFDLDDLDGVFEDESPTRYTDPALYKHQGMACLLRAEEIAPLINLKPGQCQHFIVGGNFVFGDLIEALLVKKDTQCQEMYLSSLALSAQNIETLAGMRLRNYFQGNLTILLSNWFYSHEKHALLPYLLQHLDEGDNFDLLIMRNHTKVCLLKIYNIHIVIMGSANLRSSGSVECFLIQESRELYEFYRDNIFTRFVKNFSVINRDAPAGCKNYSLDRMKAPKGLKPKSRKSLQAKVRELL